MPDVMAEERVVRLGLRFHHSYGGAGLGCSQSGTHASVTAADDHYIGLDRVDHRRLVNLGCSAKPVEIGEIAGLHRGVADGGLAGLGHRCRLLRTRLRRASGQRAQSASQKRATCQAGRGRYVEIIHVLLLSLKGSPRGAGPLLPGIAIMHGLLRPFQSMRTGWPAPSTGWT